MCMDPLESWAWEDEAEQEYRLVRELVGRTERSWTECRVLILQDELNLWRNKNQAEDARARKYIRELIGKLRELGAATGTQ